MCIGYMDDLAIVIEDPEQTQVLLNKVGETATKLGLTFNPGKCGIANYQEPVEICGEKVPIVTEDRAYKYLGTEVRPSSMTGLDDCFDRAWRTAELIEFSELTPMQKLHAIRLKVYPMLYHLLENSQASVKQVDKMNRDLRKLTKRLLFLPARAATAYLHLHRLYGGPGIPDLLLVKYKMALKTLLTMINLDGEFGEYCKKLICGPRKPDEIINLINDDKTAGCSITVKDAARALKKYSQHLELPLRFEFLEGLVTLSINGTTYKNPWPMFDKHVQKQSLKQLQKLPNQGRFWKTLTETPVTVRNIYSFHTKMCDWRFAHKARLNLIPVRANFTWHQGDQNCRRCQADRETLNHTLNNCSVHRRKIIRRHNISDLFEKMVPNQYKVAKEQRFGNLQPDIVLTDDNTLTAHIIDVKISAECPESFVSNEQIVNAKYEPLRRAFEIAGYYTRIHTIQLGCLGGLSRNSSTSLWQFFRNRKQFAAFIKKAAVSTVHSSRNISVEHLTGITQNY